MMTMPQTQGMTAAAEVWRVNADESEAVLLESCYGQCETLRLSSSGMTLGAGEGVAGSVLARRVPVFLESIDDESFERADAARASGVVSALGLPTFDQAKLTSVTVFMFRGEPGMVGAVELWAGRSGRFELGLTEAYYAGLERFGKVSRHVNFPMGSGLPGMTWQTAMPRMLSGLDNSREFLRSSGAESAGLSNGFGYPIIERNELKAVMLWLSSHATPLARRHDIWLPQGNTWKRAQSIGGSDADALDAQAIVERSATQRRPVIDDPQGWSGVTTLPVLVHDQVRAVGVLAW